MNHPAEQITSLRNPRVVEAAKLLQRKHRRQQGRFLVEGLQVLHMALDAGARPGEVFYCEELFTGPEAPALLARFRQAGGELLAVTPTVMARLSQRDEPQGIVATFALFETALPALRLPVDARSIERLIVVLDRLQDPGNLGTLIRTADAVGAAAVALIEPCVDPFDPKALRGAMGSLFNVPLVRTDDAPPLFDWLNRQGARVVGADAHHGEVWGEEIWKGGVALVLGNEARGLSEDVRGFIERWVRLPIVGRAESLNVAVAGGVLMYAWLRANWEGKDNDDERR